jgi:hypothetical protein
MAITVGQGPNVNVSKLNDNQQETTIAINPTNPQSVFIASKTYHGTVEGRFNSFANVPGVYTDHTPGLFVAYGNNAGGDWSGRISLTGGGSEACIVERSLPAADTDPQAAYDDFGNLYLTYISGIHQFGTATGGTAQSLIDASRLWVQDIWNGRLLVLRPGAGQQVLPIIGNNATTLFVGGTWATPPVMGTPYAMVSGTIGFPPVKAIVALISLNEGQSFQFLYWMDSGAVDYPAIATGPGCAANEKAVWLAWTNGLQIKAAGAPVLALGNVGAFTNPEVVNPPVPPPPPPNQYATARIAVGPIGQVMVAFCRVANPGDTTVPIYTNVDDSGLHALGFRAAATPVATTTVVQNPNPPHFPIPAQPKLGIMVQVNLAWDRSGNYIAAPNGRVHLIYTYWFGGADTDIAYTRSDNAGAAWSAWTNPWPNPSSQFLPAIAVDQSNGDVAVVWLDARNDPTNNVKVQLFAVASGDGGANWLGPYPVAQGQSDATRTSLPQQGTITSVGLNGEINDTAQNWTPNNYWRTNYKVFIPSTNESHPITASTATQLSIAPQTWTTTPVAGTTYKIQVTPPPPPPPPPPATLDPTIYWHDYGDYTGVAFDKGVFYAAWPDNSNSTNDNPNGTRGWLDVYTTRLTVTRS